MMKARLLVVLVTYKSSDYIGHCLESLIRQTWNNFDVLVVDNNDESKELAIAKSVFPEIIEISGQGNIGFAAACNLGMKYAINNNYSHVLLLNVDTVSDEHLIELLLECSGENAVTTGYIYSSRSACYVDVDSSEAYAWYSGGHIDTGNLDVFQTDYNYDIYDSKVYDVTMISGCCMCIPVRVIRETGFLDEDLFMYYEDVDYCIRLKKNGVSMKYIPKARIWHAEGGSSNHQGISVSQYYLNRNKLYIRERYPEIFDSDYSHFIHYNIDWHHVFQEDDFASSCDLLYMNKAYKDYLRNIKGKLEDFELMFDSGFSRNEVINDKTGRWAVLPVVMMSIRHYGDLDTYASFSFIISKPSPAKSIFSLKVNGKEINRFTVLGEKKREIILHIGAKKECRVEIEDLSGTPIDAEDSRKLFFSILNYGVKECDPGIASLQNRHAINAYT